MLRSCPQCGRKNRVPAARLLETGARCGACATPLPPPAEPLDVSAAEFRALTESIAAPILVDFWAAWCGPCKRAAPEVARVAHDMAGRALVLKVDTEREPALAGEFGVRGIPHFLVLKQGRPHSQHAGLVDHRQLQRWLEDASR